MNLRRLFALNLVFALFFGLGCSLIPRQLFALYGLDIGETARWTTRLVGGSILGFATLMWYGMRTNSPEAQMAITVALFVQVIVGFFASMEIQLSGALSPAGLSNPILYLFLALGYAYFVYVRPTTAGINTKSFCIAIMSKADCSSSPSNTMKLTAYSPGN